jgi:hypothetical protein
METEGPFEKLALIYQTTWSLNQRDRNLNTRRRENLVPKVQDDIEIHSVVSEIKCAKRQMYTSSPLSLLKLYLKKNAQMLNILPEVQHLSKVAC